MNIPHRVSYLIEQLLTGSKKQKLGYADLLMQKISKQKPAFFMKAGIKRKNNRYGEQNLFVRFKLKGGSTPFSYPQKKQ